MELIELTMSHADFRLAAMETFLQFFAYGAAFASVMALVIYGLMLSLEVGSRRPVRVRDTRVNATRRRR